MEITKEQKEKIEALKKSILEDFKQISKLEDVKEIKNIIFDISKRSNDLAAKLQDEQMKCDREIIFLTN